MNLLEKITFNRIIKKTGMLKENIYIEREFSTKVGLERTKIKCYFIRHFPPFKSGEADMFLMLVIRNAREYAMRVLNEYDYNYELLRIADMFAERPKFEKKDGESHSHVIKSDQYSQ